MNAELMDIREKLQRNKREVLVCQHEAQKDFDFVCNRLPEGTAYADEAHQKIAAMEAAANYIDKAAEQLAQAAK